MIRQLAIIVLAGAFTTATASAQTSGTPARDSSATMHKEGQWRASKLAGVNVYNDNNEKIGDINDVIIDKSGKVDTVVLGVGGFLGMGEHDILLEPSKIKFVNEPRRTQTSANNPPANPNANPPANRNANPPPTTRTDATATAPRAATEQWYPDHAMLSATKDQLKAMPQFKYSSYN